MLRLYILHRLSKEPMSGYDLISDLDSVTGGTWRPGSGTIYPILEDLKNGRLIEVVSRGKRSRQVYGLTRAGKEALDVYSQMINQFASRFSRIRMALLDIVSPENSTALIIEAQKMNRHVLQRAIQSKKIPEDELAYKLKEYRLLLERDLDWVKGQLKRPN